MMFISGLWICCGGGWWDVGAIVLEHSSISFIPIFTILKILKLQGLFLAKIALLCL